MPRRKPLKPLLFLLTACALVWASYEFVYLPAVKSEEMTALQPDQVEDLKRRIEEAMAGDPIFVSISSLNWRPNQNHYRVDVQMLEGRDKAQAKRLAGRVVDAEVWLYSLGR